jgi:hypothetical protein
MRPSRRLAPAAPQPRAPPRAWRQIAPLLRPANPREATPPPRLAQGCVPRTRERSSAAQLPRNHSCTHPLILSAHPAISSPGFRRSRSWRGSRTLARVVGPRVASSDGGPIEIITGAQGVAESVDPPNNNGYERTLGWAKIDQAVAALTPFADKKAAKAAGFDTSKSYDFVPFTPTLPNALGEFNSFAG